MTTICRSLIINLLLTMSLTQSAYMVDFDYGTLYNYTQFAQNELKNIKTYVRRTERFDYTNDADCHGRFMRIVYKEQKKFLKALLRWVKNTKNNMFSEKFESEVYQQWKNDFKTNYKNSLSTGDWSWSFDWN